MKRFDKILFGILIGGVPPLFWTASGVGLWYLTIRDETYAPWFALGGLLIGSIIDLVFLKKWIVKRYVLNSIILLLIFLFYNILIYGAFMGFPAFNLILAPIAGYYIGMRYRGQDIEQAKRSYLIMIIPHATAFVMLTLCTLTTMMVIGERTIGSEVQSIFNLNFELSHSVVLLISLIGSILLVYLEYLLTKIALKRTLS